MNINALHESRRFKNLNDIFKNDSMNLLVNIRPSTASNVQSADSMIIAKFKEIISFYEQYGRKPAMDSTDFSEELLGIALNQMANNPDQKKELKPYDAYDLLEIESLQSAVTTSLEQPTINTNQEIGHSNTSHVITSLSDIFSSDTLGLLDNLGNIDILGDNIHSTNVRKRIENSADEIGDRFECKDFEDFEPIFFKIRQFMYQGKYKIQKENPTQYVRKNAVLVLMDMLCFVADIEEDQNRINSLFKDRVRLIFANGTESNMLARSLATALSKHKQTSYHVLITDQEWADQHPTEQTDVYHQINDKSRTGVIYIAKLKAPKQELVNYQHLYKIGFSINTGQERIKNCLKDETFLYSEVEILAEYEVHNANAQKIEYLLHSFFANQKLKIKLLSINGKYYSPNEWFNVPLSEIDTALNLILTGEISQYWFNPYTQKIERKSQ